MKKWLILTDDGQVHELHYNIDLFMLILNGKIVSPRFENVLQVKETIKQFGYTVTEFCQVDGSNWTIDL